MRTQPDSREPCNPRQHERVLSGHITSQQAWQEYGVKENDNIQHPDDACWGLLFFFFQTVVKSSSCTGKQAKYRSSVGSVCDALCGVTDVGLSHK